MLITSDSTSEGDFQKWCESHPVIFIALGYVRQIPHPRIHATNGKLYIPDFLVQRSNGSWEIFELKTPSASILKNKERRETFYASFEDYLSQCHDYSEALDEASVRTQLEHEHSINLKNKKPPSILVAGSSEGLDAERLFRLCSRRTPPITVFTYDDIKAALISYRTFNFERYDSAQGLSVHSVLCIHKPENPPFVNHILDLGEKENQDRVSIYIDERGYLRINVWDSNGDQHTARAAKPFQHSDYEILRWLIIEVGVSEGFGFISIQIDGNYSTDIKIQDFPFGISHEWVIGSDWKAAQPSWFSLVELAVINRVLTFDEKIRLRQHTINAGKNFPPEIMDFDWSAYYTAGFGLQFEFKGHKWMHTAGHPSRAKDNPENA